MKKELFELTKEEASQFMNQEGVRELDYIQDDGYKLFGLSVQESIKLRVYEDGKFFLDTIVPEEIQCAPCEIKFKTKKHGCCPICKTDIRTIMLRNKVFEETFRKFEAAYSKLLNSGLRLAQPICLYLSDNMNKEEADEMYAVSKKNMDSVEIELKSFDWIFEEGIMERVQKIKEVSSNANSAKILMSEK